MLHRVKGVTVFPQRELFVKSQPSDNDFSFIFDTGGSAQK